VLLCRLVVLRVLLLLLQVPAATSGLAGRSAGAADQHLDLGQAVNQACQFSRVQALLVLLQQLLQLLDACGTYDGAKQLRLEPSAVCTPAWRLRCSLATSVRLM
jgi:hypothetical protein